MSKLCVKFSACDILLCMFSDTIHACAILIKTNWVENENFKVIGQNLRKFGSSKEEFRFQAVEALVGLAGS